MTPSEPGLPRESTVDREIVGGPIDYVTQVFAVVAVELEKLRHDPLELLTRAVQPALWLLLFGEVMARVRGLSSGNLQYLDFLSAGVLAQSVLFVAIFNGISTIWERDLGILHRYLASPAPRSALVLGKSLSGSVRALSQAVIVYALAFAIGVDIKLNPFAIAGVIVLITLGACLFSAVSLIIACIVKTRERFMGIGQVLTMPIFFASNAIYPIDLMPPWLRVLSSLNPLTYEVDGLRSLMLAGSQSAYGLGADFVVLFGIFAALIGVAAKMYARMGY